jgi:hypothetical protein
MIAHLRGGPFDQKEYVLYRARRFYTRRVHRGAVRRALGSGPRYAWYEIDQTWEDGQVTHGEYRFLHVGGKAHTESERAA